MQFDDQKSKVEGRQEQDQSKDCKYIFICGAIVSGIGKGVTNSSMGMLLREYGYAVSFMKIDPYLNLDAGTMSPYEHGEVFVTSDGGEVDLDLGNYERFIDLNLTFKHSLTTGKLYHKILEKERAGEFLGKTVQVIPHVVNEIKDWIRSVGKIIVNKTTNEQPEILLVEVGGTVGDLESSQYYEAVRQLIVEEGKENVALIQLTYVMTLGGEQKTKPAQNGLKDLRYTGLQADFLVCRSEDVLEQGPRDKLSLQSSISPDNVQQQFKTAQIFSVPNVNHIYEVPLTLEKQNFVTKILKKLQLPIKRQPNLVRYQEFSIDYYKIKQYPKKFRIGIFGKYMENMDAYMSLCKAILEAAYENKMNIEIIAYDLVANTGNNQLLNEIMKSVDGVIVPGGFGDRAWEDKIYAAQLARDLKIPFLGICYGFQAAVCAQVRHKLGIKDATSQENSSKSFELPPLDNHYIIYIPEISKTIMGGTMRRGVKTTYIRYQKQIHLNKSDKTSLAYQIYQSEEIIERHRHRFEVNPAKIAEIEQGGGRFTGKDVSGIRMEIFELPQTEHPFYIGVQYHPEFTSGNFRANKLFVSFLSAVKSENWLESSSPLMKSNIDSMNSQKYTADSTPDFVQNESTYEDGILEYLRLHPSLLSKAINQQNQPVESTEQQQG